MPQPTAEKPRRLRFTLSGVAVAIAVLCVVLAWLPGAALLLVGVAPGAVGFVVFVLADPSYHDGFAMLGLFLMAVGLMFSGPLIAMVISFGQ